MSENYAVTISAGEVVNVTILTETISVLIGAAGPALELQQAAGYLQYRAVGTVTWTNLITLASITGSNGTNGTDGLNIELQKTSTHVQWRVTGGTWADLYALADVTGTSLPIGSIVRSTQTPGSAWHRCDGSALAQADHPLLYAQLGLKHDFASWTAVGPNSASWSHIAYGNGIWISIRPFYIDWSDDDGATWNQVDPSGNFRDIAYSPTLGMFVIVGDAGILSSSVNGGVTWTPRTSSFESSTIWGVAWCYDRFVAVGAGGKIATSTNGIDWTQKTSNTAQILYAAAGKSGMIVAVGAAGTIVSSADSGETWVVRTSNAYASGTLYGIAYASTVNRFVASGEYSQLVWSADGINWLPIYLSLYGLLNLSVYSIGTDGNIFIVQVSNGTTHVLKEDMSLCPISAYSGASVCGVGYGNGNWILSGGANSGKATFSYNTATHFRLPKPALDSGITYDTWIMGD